MILAPAGRGRSRGRVSAGAVWGKMEVNTGGLQELPQLEY